ncbi:MAG: alpha/beta fold hydrolase [Desulfobulbaceae bacterium]|nr:alpha/beta fold hydrolase [Desulfobulbaceae bacterium]
MRVALLIISICTSFLVLAEEIPVESFGHLPYVEQPELSPDGNYVAAVLNTGDVPAVVVGAFGGTDLQAVLQLKAADDRIEWMRWANDDRLLVSASFSSYFGGARFRLRRLYAVDRDGANLLALERKVARKALRFEWAVNTDNILSILPDEPHQILLELYDPRDKGPAVFKVDIYKNKFEKQFPNTYEVDRWYADRSGKVTLGLGVDKDVATTWYKNPENGRWQELYSKKMFEGDTFYAVTVDGDMAVVFSDHELGREALWRYNIASGQFEELIYAADAYDVDAALLNIDQNEVIGAAYMDNFEKRQYFDPAEAKMDDLVRKTFPQYRTYIVSRDRSQTRFIVAGSRDDAPVRYFWLDTVAKRGGAWYSQYPQLDGLTLAKVEPIAFEAGDGMKLNGYLTMPPDAVDKPALIVLPHGGPQSRDYQNFDPYVQFLANRGFAVLQVNFRGSSGFNNAYKTSGYGEWGMAMQQDVYDAIDWLGERGTVDTKRACMIGFSYGGYVALTAAFQRPKQFKCIVSVAGIGNLVDLVESSARYKTAQVSQRKTVGDTRDSQQKKVLYQNSAIHFVEKIKSPILLIHGDHDTQVRVKQSREFYAAAHAANVDIEYIELEDGTHYLDENKNRLVVFRAMDDFLKKYLH